MSGSNFTEQACITKGCHAVIVMHRDVDAKLRRTGERFFCPNGHGQWYIVGKTDEQKRIEELERQLRHMTSDRDWFLREYTAAVRSCPWVGCGFVAETGSEWDRRALHTHMRAKHGMPSLALVRQHEAEAS